ncbi:MAG TPA: hypothetical protein VKB89_13260 [Xanthobacteraceae bacterium]|nr:hypothetical protein [Xanthobacteraceae bacterium]
MDFSVSAWLAGTYWKADSRYRGSAMARSKSVYPQGPDEYTTRIFIEYERLVADSEMQIRKLCEFASLEIDGVLDSMLKHPLPFSRNTLTPPHPEKWRQHEKELDRVMPSLEPVTAEIEKIQQVGK